MSSRERTTKGIEKFKNEHNVIQEQMGKTLSLKKSTNRFIVAYDHFDRPLAECKVCGCQTIHIHTRLCDPCWELDSRVRKNFEAAEKIYLYYKDKFNAKNKQRSR